MRILLTLIFAMTAAIPAFSQEEVKVPDDVMTTFINKFRGAEEIAWEKDGKNYEVEFTMEGVTYSAVFDKKGFWLETGKDADESVLPQAVKDQIAAQFAGYTIEEVEVVSTPKMLEGFEVELKGEKDMIEALFDYKGDLLEKSKEKNDDEE